MIDGGLFRGRRWHARCDAERAHTLALCNTTPEATWTGYDAILDQIRDGYLMATGPMIEPIDAWQRRQYAAFQNAAIALHAERRPPGKLGAGTMHGHFESSRFTQDAAVME